MAPAGPVIRTSADAAALFAHLARQPREVIGVAYLDRDWRLLALRHGLAGTADRADVPLRAIARDAILFGAARVVLAHNHPSGDLTPSDADLRVTRRLGRALAALGTPLVEHLVLGGIRYVSLSATGVI